MAAKPLVIVESPAKAKTLGRFLGANYRVEASYGHIRDLPESAAEVPKEIKEKDWGRMGVDVESDFTPYYVVPDDKRKQVAAPEGRRSRTRRKCCWRPTRIAKGESISWHLAQVLKPKVPVRRIVFHEITEEAVSEALSTPERRQREPGPRAGEPPHPRSAVRLHAVAGALEEGADRAERRPRAERGGSPDRRARGRATRVPFRRSTGISRRRSKGDGREFVATLARIGDQRVATGKDFDAQTGALETSSAVCSTSRRPAARRGAPRQRAVDGHVGRAEAGRRTAGAAVHDVDAHAGGQPQARVLHRADDAGGAAAVPGRRRRQRRDGRSDHLPPHRLHDAQSDKALDESARVIREMFGGRVLRRPAALSDARSRTRRKRTRPSGRATSDWRRASSRACSIPTTSSSTT